MHLTEAERKVMEVLWERDEMTAKEIAAELFLSEGTVRNYLSSILDKLQLRDRTQVAVFYYQHR